MNPVTLTAEDYARLKLLLPSGQKTPALQQLRAELERATILDPAAIPSTIVRMGSRVEIEDLESGEVEEYTLTFPDQANVDARRLSVLAPIGTAILGFAEGDEVSWPTPGGPRRIRLRRVAPPAADALTTAAPPWSMATIGRH